MTWRRTLAKQSIQDSGIACCMPSVTDLDERLRAVLHVLHLIFNEGYAATSGPTLYRTDLSSEAIRLCRAVQQWRSDDPEVVGLLALMLLTEARRAARVGPSGELVP